MQRADLGDVQINYVIEGSDTAPTLVFAQGLGCDLRIWEEVVERLPKSLRILRYDLRGHGQSSCPEPPYRMGNLVRDSERLLDHLNIRDSLFIGHGLGGMVAQGLAIKRLDQIRAMVLSNTAAKLGMADMWETRSAQVLGHGVSALEQDTMKRWFTRAFLKSNEIAPWRDMFLSQPENGYAGSCAAIAGTDFYTPTSGLRLPALGIAGTEDGVTPADLVRETVGLIPGSDVAIVRRAGHLPSVEQPDTYTQLLMEFIDRTGHLGIAR